MRGGGSLGTAVHQAANSGQRSSALSCEFASSKSPGGSALGENEEFELGNEHAQVIIYLK